MMDLKEYVMNPPKDIFGKLASIKNPKLTYLEEVQNAIKRSIIGKFRAEFQRIQDSLALSEGSRNVRTLEPVLNCLPDPIRLTLEVELKNIEADISKNLQEHAEELNKIIVSTDPSTTASFLSTCKSQRMESSIKTLHVSILRQSQELNSKIATKVIEKDMKEALGHLKKLFEYNQHLNNIPEVEQRWTDCRTQVSSAFDNICSDFAKKIDNASSDKIITQEIAPLAEKDFMHLIDFINFKENNPTFLDILPENIDNKIADLNNKLLVYLENNQNWFDQSLQTSNSFGIRNALNIMNQWDSLFQKVKPYAEAYGRKGLLQIDRLNKIKAYQQMVDVISKTIQSLKTKIIDIQLINVETQGFSDARDGYYRQIGVNLCFLINLVRLEVEGIGINVSDLKEECCYILATKLQKLFKDTNDLQESVLDAKTLSSVDLNTLDVNYNNLVSFAKHIKVVHVPGIKDYEQISKNILGHIDSLFASVDLTLPIERNSRISSCIIKMKIFAHHLSSFKKRINETIDDLLEVYKKNNGAEAIARLRTILNRDPNGVGASVVLAHKAFQGHAFSLFNQKTQKRGIDYVLEHIEGNDLDKKLLEKRYNEFSKTFQDLVQQYLKPKIEFDKLIATIKLIVGNVKQENNIIMWKHHVKSQVPNLVAHVFALWTLQNATHYFEAQSLVHKDSYLFKPHAAQVVSMFRMLGIGDKKEELKNNLIQIGTGEGKSITLAISAAVLALLGFDVSCACYSESLSQRDKKDFQQLFSSLGVEKHIHYGTFNKLCEGVINQYGDIRKVVEKLISQNVNDAVTNKQGVNRVKILLIDEVDVFFSKSFYGKLYTPYSTLQDPTITNLLDLIWNERISQWDLAKIKNTIQFRDCCTRFTGWEDLIEEAIKEVISDLRSYKSHGYEVKDDKIGYKQQDRIVFNVMFGYKTLFAYYHENEQGKISKSSLEENKCLRIKCGNFSYAEISRKFSYTIGVTGTLKTLSELELQVVENDFQIHKKTFIPSIFEKNNLNFTKEVDLKVGNREYYFNRITEEIKDKIEIKRAVLVFFDSKAQLMEYYKYYNSNPGILQKKVYIITEDTSIQEQDNIIKRAPTSGQITLLTRTFGRGIDFVCHDQVVIANGGTHVIQTFLSDELSEEVQIKGRTARQGDYGSYSMILRDKSLERFLITQKDLKAVRNQNPILTRFVNLITSSNEKTYSCEYDFLHEKREDFFKTSYKENIKFVEDYRKQHVKADEFLGNIWQGKTQQVKQFLLEENKGPEGQPCSRTIVLMNATGSMSHLLQKTRNTVGTMYERACEVLKEHNISIDSFQIQFAVYRNYGNTEGFLLQSSLWETKPDNLRAFMERIVASRSLGNEAVEIGLWHVNQENEKEKISQVILIGDASPNTETEVTQRRAHHLGEPYWETTKFKNTTYYTTELNKLKQHGIPVHAFHVNQFAEAKFKEIAREMGGRSEMLDINSAEGAAMLTDLVTEEVLNSVEKSSGRDGKALVDAYRIKFKKNDI